MKMSRWAISMTNAAGDAFSFSRLRPPEAPASAACRGAVTARRVSPADPPQPSAGSGKRWKDEAMSHFPRFMPPKASFHC